VEKTTNKTSAAKKAPKKVKRKKAPKSLTPDYRPSGNEPFMATVMLEYFNQKLLKWRESLLEESNETLQHLQENSVPEADLADRASTETDRALELRTRDRARKLIAKIDEALERIQDGTYGYCEETDEPISLKRLEARPIATLSIEAQERHERMEKTHRDD
jgi:DnaK suppressor protein